MRRVFKLGRKTGEIEVFKLIHSESKTDFRAQQAGGVLDKGRKKGFVLNPFICLFNKLTWRWY